MNKIITITRQFGSGGREIGKKLAEAYGIPFYDNEIISRAAKDTGFAEAAFERAEDKASNSLLYSIAMGMNVFSSQDVGFSGLSLDDRIFLAQSKVIRNVAKEGPCVIVGRCADYILKNQENVVNLFIRATLDFRIKRAIEAQQTGQLFFYVKFHEITFPKIMMPYSTAGIPCFQELFSGLDVLSEIPTKSAGNSRRASPAFASFTAF